ncbi:ClpP/crotonase [Rhizodiscina lignyota]|uniref:ClpP/crotonase n=1 Tax=Rhizodiscina lignyota TaxID=1504668 RepID=A0A9P4I6Q6_9PEZI|nr:ClpP/crotonase [Rhizodiscina lignyota]
MGPAYPTLPSDHPASIQFSAWLTVFNRADKQALLEYHTGPAFPYSAASHDVDDINRELRLAKATGGFDVVDIESISEPSTVVVVMKEKLRPQYARASMVVDVSKDIHPVTKFGIHPITTPIKFIPKDDPRRPRYEKALHPLTTYTRGALIDGIGEVLRNQYVIPDKVETMVSALKGHLDNGDYDNFTESEKYAVRLTEDLHASGHDKHMGVFFIEPRGDPDGEPKKPPPGKLLEDLRSVNFLFNVSLDYDTIPSRTIVTVAINGFLPTEPDFPEYQEIRAAIGKILSTVSDTDALIIDLRRNEGGSPWTVAFVLSYFVDDAPVHILDMVDRSGEIIKSFSTLPVSELPAGTTCFGGTKPLFVLTAKDTISGGEEMAYDLQAFKRSKAVIGEGNDATAGAANPVTNPRFICEDIFGKSWWVVAVPRERPVHAVTGTNWEGVGVLSDVVAGKGEWKETNDAEAVGKDLIKRIFEAQGSREL